MCLRFLSFLSQLGFSLRGSEVNWGRWGDSEGFWGRWGDFRRSSWAVSVQKRSWTDAVIVDHPQQKSGWMPYLTKGTFLSSKSCARYGKARCIHCSCVQDAEAEAERFSHCLMGTRGAEFETSPDPPGIGLKNSAISPGATFVEAVRGYLHAEESFSLDISER